jgi:UDP-GlcNAc3NAcA epimerase
MFTLLTVIGARPQIIKAAALSRAIKASEGKIREIIVHTGQHYDENMSEVFFQELGIPSPQYNLHCGSGNHGKTTAQMISGIEEILLKEKPSALLVYGDTNSTLAGAIAASKLLIPVLHVEAGLRSFNKNMPEEINRILCDHVSTLLFSPTEVGIDNLKREGIINHAAKPINADNPQVFHCGDVMYDNSMYFSELADKKTELIEKYSLVKNNFILATIHRNNNTDDPIRLSNLFSALNKISHQENKKVFLPLHPRTAHLLDQNVHPPLLNEIRSNKNFIISTPVSFLEMIALEKNCEMICTDSGGVQKEAYFFKKPCIILRPETEWVELVKSGNAFITDTDENKIIEAYHYFANKKETSFPPFYGDGKAAAFILKKILDFLNEV